MSLVPGVMYVQFFPDFDGTLLAVRLELGDRRLRSRSFEEQDRIQGVVVADRPWMISFGEMETVWFQGTGLSLQRSRLRYEVRV